MKTTSSYATETKNRIQPSRWSMRHGRRVRGGIVAMLAAGMLLPAAPARAAGITVAAGLVHVEDDGQCSLREAVDNANDDAQTHTDCPAGSGADVLTLPAGTYAVGGPQRVGGWKPQTAFEITSPMSLVGAGALGRVGDGATVLDGGGVIRHFLVYGSQVSLHLEDMRVENGNADDKDWGGAVLNHGNLSTLRVWFRGNEAHNGGAVANLAGWTNYNAVFVAEATTFSQNTARDDGGAIVNSGDVTVVGGALSSNEASVGGAIANIDTSGGTNVTVVDAVLASNKADGGGAAIVNRAGGEAVISDSVVVQNASPWGALWNHEGDMTVRASSVRNNSAPGIVNFDGRARITDSTVSGNRGEKAGGVWNFTEGGGHWEYGTWHPATARMDIRQSTISDNSTWTTQVLPLPDPWQSPMGGGVSSNDYSLDDRQHPAYLYLTMTNVTVVGNWSPAGVQVRADSDEHRADGAVEATLRNTVIAAAAGNGASCDDPDSPTGVVAWAGHNNLSDDSSCGGGFTQAPALLQPLADNGGPTRTHQLHPASPAIDAGDQQFCTYLREGRGQGRTPNDQRGPGFPRTVGASCDIGAVEGGVLELTDVLKLDVEQLRLASSGGEGLRTSLVSKLDAAKDAVERGSTDAAAGQLDAFANQVSADEGRRIAEHDAQRLVMGARTIIDLLTTPAPDQR